MKRIGVRELRQNASVYLRAVQEGESFEVTDRGRPVAMLIPRPENRIEQLIASGKLRPAKGDLRDLPPPIPLQPGEPTLTEILLQMRDEERF